MDDQMVRQLQVGLQLADSKAVTDLIQRGHGPRLMLAMTALNDPDRQAEAYTAFVAIGRDLGLRCWSARSIPTLARDLLAFVSVWERATPDQASALVLALTEGVDEAIRLMPARAGLPSGGR